MAKIGSKAKPRIVTLTLSEEAIFSDKRTVAHIIKYVAPKYKKLRPGEFLAINVKRKEYIRGQDKIISEGSMLLKKGRRKPTRDSLRAIGRSFNAFISEKYGIEGTPRFEDEIAPYIGEPAYSPDIEYKPTEEKKKKIKIRKRPPYEGDKRYKVRYDWKAKRYRDRKGHFR